MSNQLRILTIMPSIPLQGMERATIKIMQELRDRGATVTFVLERDYAIPVRDEVKRLGFEFYDIPAPPRLTLKLNPVTIWHLFSQIISLSWRVFKISKQVKPTHVHVTNVGYFISVLPYLMMTRSQVIFRLPEPPETELSSKKQKISDFVWRRLVLPYSDQVVSNCVYTGNIAEHLMLGRKVTIIRNMLPRVPARNHDAPTLDRQKFNVVYTGRIRENKGVGILLETAVKLVQEHDNIQFYLAGEKDWENPFAKEWEQKLIALKLTHRIQLLGEVHDIFGLLQQANIHVCPSISSIESFPNVVLEAKSQSIPSVVFPTAGLPEAVEHEVTGYICQDQTVKALSLGIYYYYQQPERCQSAGQAAYASLQQYSESNVMDVWIELYNRS